MAKTVTFTRSAFSQRIVLISMIGISMASTGLGATGTLIGYFLPMPIVKPLRSNKWACSIVGKRDICNGLEDTTCKVYSYWDGPVIKGPDGKYHMFASRWKESGGHWDWLNSVGVHAVSDSIMGPYVDKGICWPGNRNGKGHNLTILQLKDGTYASVVSDTRPGDFFTAPTLDGPWTFAGSIKITANGYPVPQIANLSIIIRPDDGKFMVVARNGQIMISSGGLTGPYVLQGNSVYNTVNLPDLEDPVLWHSGGLYHIVVNSWSERKAFHLTSVDGIKNWKNQGLAFDPKSDFLRYTDGTVNHWNKIERPGVVIENGHVTHFTFAVIDVEKDKDVGNDGHGSKIIVVPFDGASMDGPAVTCSGLPADNRQQTGKSAVTVARSSGGRVSIHAPFQCPYVICIARVNGTIVRTVQAEKAAPYAFDLVTGAYIVSVTGGSDRLVMTLAAY
jgi:hypothetical protein